MKRFNATSTMVEEDDGWYVRYVDAEDEIDRLKRERKELGQLLLEGRNLMAESITEIETFKAENEQLRSQVEMLSTPHTDDFFASKKDK
jgi:hypothetical protein